MVHVNSINQIYQIESVCPLCGRLISVCGTRSGTTSVEQELPSVGSQPSLPENRPDSIRRRFVSSIGMSGIVTWSILLLTFVNGVLSQQSARDFINGLEQPQMRYENPERVRELASIFELIQSAAVLQRQAQRARALNIIGADEGDVPGAGTEVVGMDQYESSNNVMPGPAVPLGMLIQNRDLQNLIQQQEYSEVGRQDKRGSYMALCHFKICNMGRKRTSKWTPWLRTENV